MTTCITYKHLHPQPPNLADTTVCVRRVEDGNEVPKHGIGDVIQLTDERLEEKAEKPFRVVDVETPFSSGWGEGGMTTQYVHVVVTDVEDVALE